MQGRVRTVLVVCAVHEIRENLNNQILQRNVGRILQKIKQKWLTKITECVAVWDIEYVGILNRH